MKMNENDYFQICLVCRGTGKAFSLKHFGWSALCVIVVLILIGLIISNEVYELSAFLVMLTIFAIVMFVYGVTKKECRTCNGKGKIFGR